MPEKLQRQPGRTRDHPTIARPRYPKRGAVLTTITINSFLEYSGAGLGILGWLGVRQVTSIGAQELGFLVWIASGLILIAWGYHTRARAIILINAVNVIMAVSALAALV